MTNTTAANVNHRKPVLRLKLGGSSSPDPAPHPVPTPTPPPKPAPAAVPVSARVKISEVETKKRIDEGRAKAIAEYEAAEKAKVATRIEAYEQGKLDLERRAQAMLASLIGCWPGCFNAERPRPLKIGIDRDLTALSCSLSEETDLRRALKGYVSSPAYLAALVDGAERIDLDGKPVGIVTSGHAHHAQWLPRNQKAKA